MGAKTDVSSVLPVATHNIEQRFLGLSEWLDVVRYPDGVRADGERIGDVRRIAQQSKDGLSKMYDVLASMQRALIDTRDRISKLDSL